MVPKALGGLAPASFSLLYPCLLYPCHTGLFSMPGNKMETTDGTPSWSGSQPAR